MKEFRIVKAALAGWLLALVTMNAMAGPDFSMTLQPDKATLIPNETSSFVISLAPLNGFTNQVTLTNGTLPTGVKAQFSPEEVTLPGTAILTLTAATNAELGDFTLDIIGAGGGVTNTSSSSVTVNFGLLPQCTGAVSGTVTDAKTGLPITNAVVETYLEGNYGQTDVHGNYLLTNLFLTGNNAPTYYEITASKTGYWASEDSTIYAVCDATNLLDIQLVPVEYGSLSGKVTYQDGTPVTNAPVVLAGEYSTVTDVNGDYSFTNVSLNYTNAPILDYVETSRPGIYWQAASNVVIQANSNSVQNLLAVPICYGIVLGQVIYGDTKLPATNAQVTIDGTQGTVYGTTDGEGNYGLTNVGLQINGTLVGATVGASAPNYTGAYTNVSLTNCGEVVTAPTIALPPLPKYYYAGASGHVYDSQTDKPIAGADVTIGVGTLTDSNGFYLTTNINLGYSTQGNYEEVASASGYYTVESNITVIANTIATQDLYLLRMQYGYVTGLVRDSVTQAPVTNAFVLLNDLGQEYYLLTDTNGRYTSGALSLQSPNSPTTVYLETQPTGYYSAGTNWTIAAGTTNTVNLDVLKVCTGAKIIGTVVNADTQGPITNATLYASSGATAESDAQGNFILTNITVGNDNSPIQVTITANAPGFISQNKSVTVFCDATIVTEFGAPPTALGTIEGLVTNQLTGAPLTNVFIGSEFGESTTTDTNGFYELTQAPLGANNTARTWTVTAIPTGFTAQTLPVTVTSNGPAELNFGFGAPPTSLIVTASGTPNPVTVSNDVTYLITLTNTVADATNVVLTDTLPTNVTLVDAVITNSPATPFGAPVISNNVITISADGFGSNSSVSLSITVEALEAGLLTNSAAVTSATPDLDPTGNDRKAMVITTAVAPAPPTELIVSATVTPATTTVGSNILYTVTLTNTVATAANVQLTDTLPTTVSFVSASVSNGPGGTFSAPTFSGGAVTTESASFASNSIVVLYITATPTAAGMLTNVTRVSSATTNLAPGSVLSAIVSSAATAPVVPENADLALSMTATPNPVLVGNQLTYMLRVTNLGPQTASSIVLTDSFPANVTFGSATVSQGSFAQIATGLEWTIGTVSNQGGASATVVVLPVLTGTLSNSATVSILAGSAVSDTNLANNTAEVTTLATAATVSNLTVTAGPIAFNPQTGLYEQSVTVNNTGGVIAAAVRLAVQALPAYVQLYNGRGTTNGTPYVEYDEPVGVGGDVVFALEYYDKTRKEFASPTFAATALVALTIPTPTGTFLQLDAGSPFLSEGELTIEFATVPGHTYVVEYSSDMENWQTATPPIVAKNTRTQWVDAGPPETVSPPGTPGERFYRVVQTN